MLGEPFDTGWDAVFDRGATIGEADRYPSRDEIERVMRDVSRRLFTLLNPSSHLAAPRRRLSGRSDLPLTKGSGRSLGHSQISLTRDTYSYVLPVLGDTQPNRIDALVRVQPALGNGGYQRGCQTIEKLVSLPFANWNQMTEWLRRVEALRPAA
jgi:hypothetical protein